MELVISIIYGSVRNARQGIKAARYLEQKLRERDIKCHFIDPLEYKLPLLDKMFKEYEPGTAPEVMEKLASLFNNSDAFLVVTGEYNNGIPPALKNLLDHFQREYYFKPSAIASYSDGRFGGIRAAIQLRIVLAELGMPAISSILSFPEIINAFNTDLTPKDDHIDSSISKFLDEFFWYAEAFKRQRELGLPY